jgi:hypothetical protein
MLAITRAADRMLNALAPKITADAGCTARSYWSFCYCLFVGNEFYDEYSQRCTIAASCAKNCGPCEAMGVCYSS